MYLTVIAITLLIKNINIDSDIKSKLIKLYIFCFLYIIILVNFISFSLLINISLHIDFVFSNIIKLFNTLMLCLGFLASILGINGGSKVPYNSVFSLACAWCINLHLDNGLLKKYDLCYEGRLHDPYEELKALMLDKLHGGLSPNAQSRYVNSLLYSTGSSKVFAAADELRVLRDMSFTCTHPEHLKDIMSNREL